MKEEKEAGNKDEPTVRFQYMAITRSNIEDPSPERNDAAEDAEKELEYLDQQGLLRLGHPDSTTNVNSVIVQPALRSSFVSQSAARAVTADHPLIRSSTQQRRSPRLDTTNRVKRVLFQNPRPAIKRALGHIVPRHPSPPPREIVPPSPSVSLPTSPPTSPPVTFVDTFNDHAGEARAITNSLRARFVINKVVDRMHGMLTSGI